MLRLAALAMAASLSLLCGAEDPDGFSQPVPTAGLRMAAVGMGTAGLQAETERVVCVGLREGFRLFDTAQAREWYQEEGLGRALASCGVAVQDVMVVTKVHPRSFELGAMRAAVQRSRQLIYGEALGVLDVVLLHAPTCWRGHCTPEQERHGWREGWANLETMKEDGLVRHIGVSNFDEELLSELLAVANRKVAVVQNWMDPFHQDRGTRALAARHGLTYMAYSSLGTQWGDRNPVLADPTLQRMADAHGCTVSAVVLSWLRQEGVVAIPRASQTSHVAANARALEAEGFLSAEEMEAVRALDGSIGAPWD